MTLDDYRNARMPVSYWRVGARIAILNAITEHEAACKGDHAALVRMVDAAYPFGEREMYPYKCWLKERRLFIESLNSAPVEARALLEEQAPHRLARVCPACAAKVSKPCVDYEAATDADYAAWEERRAGRCASVVPDPPCDQRVELIVPHHARLVGHLGNGPLFGGRDA